MSAISLIARIILIVANSVLLLLALVIFIICIIITSSNVVFSSLTSTLDEQLQTAYSQLGTTVDIEKLALTEFMSPVSYVLIVLSIGIGALSVLGMIGGCCTIKIVLIVYLIAISSAFLVQFIFFILVYASKSAMEAMLKPYLKDTLDDYAGIEGTDASSLIWNALMNYKKCCGVDDYTDFQNLANWPAPINGVQYSLQTPVVCCITKSTTFTCAESPSVETSYYQIGCFDKISDMIVNNAFAMIVIVFLLATQSPRIPPLSTSKTHSPSEETIESLTEEGKEGEQKLPGSPSETPEGGSPGGSSDIHRYSSSGPILSTTSLLLE